MNSGLYFGDCLNLLKLLPDNCIHMVLGDLPYGTTQCKWDTPIDLVKLWAQLTRVCIPAAAICMYAQTPFDKVLGMSNLDMLRYEWIWEKSAATGHLNAKKMPMKAHENVLVFYKQLPIYNPQKTTGHVRKVSEAKHKIKCKESELYAKGQKATTYDSTERYPRSVLRFKSDKQTSNLHDAQKPVAANKYFIQTYTNEGMFVLDMTCGSGTTAIACIETNRNFICMENDPVEFSKAKNRIAAYNT